MWHIRFILDLTPLWGAVCVKSALIRHASRPVPTDDMHMPTCMHYYNHPTKCINQRVIYQCNMPALVQYVNANMYIMCWHAYAVCQYKQVVNYKTRNGTEWNGMEKLIKHGTELLSRHKVFPRTHGPRSYTHANCSCTRRALVSWKRMGRQADYLLYNIYRYKSNNIYLPGIVCKTQSFSICRFTQLLSAMNSLSSSIKSPSLFKSKLGECNKLLTFSSILIISTLHVGSYIS